MVHAGGCVQVGLRNADDQMLVFEMKRSFFLLSFLFPLALSACAAGTGIPSTVTPPQPEVDCPDPSGRSKLVEGSSFRDLSASLA
jgi:hypothetical protein